MKRPTSYDGIDFRSVEAVFADFAGFSNLHPVRKRRLALLLFESRVKHDYFHRQDATVSPKTSAEKLRNLLGSLSLLETFARDSGFDPSKSAAIDPASRDAMNRLVWAADDLGPDERQSVINLMSAAETVYKVAKYAERAMAAHIRRKEVETAIVWLCGSKLPEIYCKIFGAKFTTTRLNNPGIAFVQTALRAIKVRNAISDDTVLSHFKAARAVRRS